MAGINSKVTARSAVNRTLPRQINPKVTPRVAGKDGKVTSRLAGIDSKVTATLAVR